jgi:hypothetical protein
MVSPSQQARRQLAAPEACDGGIDVVTSVAQDNFAVSWEQHVRPERRDSGHARGKHSYVRIRRGEHDYATPREHHVPAEQEPPPPNLEQIRQVSLGVTRRLHCLEGKRARGDAARPDRLVDACWGDGEVRWIRSGTPRNVQAERTLVGAPPAWSACAWVSKIFEIRFRVTPDASMAARILSCPSPQPASIRTASLLDETRYVWQSSGCEVEKPSRPLPTRWTPSASCNGNRPQHRDRLAGVDPRLPSQHHHRPIEWREHALGNHSVHVDIGNREA